MKENLSASEKRLAAHEGGRHFVAKPPFFKEVSCPFGHKTGKDMEQK